MPYVMDSGAHKVGDDPYTVSFAMASVVFLMITIARTKLTLYTIWASLFFFVSIIAFYFGVGSGTAESLRDLATNIWPKLFLTFLITVLAVADVVEEEGRSRGNHGTDHDTDNIDVTDGELHDPAGMHEIAQARARRSGGGILGILTTPIFWIIILAAAGAAVYYKRDTLYQKFAGGSNNTATVTAQQGQVKPRSSPTPTPKPRQEPSPTPQAPPPVTAKSGQSLFIDVTMALVQLGDVLVINGQRYGVWAPGKSAQIPANTPDNLTVEIFRRDESGKSNKIGTCTIQMAEKKCQ